MATKTEPAITATNPPNAASLLSIRAVAKHFGKNIVLRDLSLEIAEGEFLTILGESGSGKTTLLRILAGFEQPTSGEVWMSGERLDTLPPYRRRVNTVFQSYALFPHMTVEQNVGYGLAIAKRPAAEIESRVAGALAKVKMSAYAKSKPSKISGGQQQRIALARALVNRPQVLLLDEPLSALDANLRREMQVELKALQREVGITFIFVTHDQDEAMVMSDRIALLRSGELEQVATPREIYSRPATSYTAQFIGHTNLLHTDVHNGTAMCDRLAWPTSLPDGEALFSLRPESIRLAKAAPAPISSSPINSSKITSQKIADGIRFRATLRDQAFHGATELLRVECAGGLILTIRTASHELPKGPLEFEFNAADAVPVRAIAPDSNAKDPNAKDSNQKDSNKKDRV
jgi:ABC-type Fe3+/spermidine/putrescine transport system ATPase subunit